MLAASLSPSSSFRSPATFDPATSCSPRSLPPQHDPRSKPYQAQSSLARAEQSRQHYPSPSPIQTPLRRSASAVSLESVHHSTKARRMVDASTQYSPPGQSSSPQISTKTPTNTIAGLQIEDRKGKAPAKQTPSPEQPINASRFSQATTLGSSTEPGRSTSRSKIKRQAVDELEADKGNGKDLQPNSVFDSPTKKTKPDSQPLKIVPDDYSQCDPRDLVILISSMLMELIRFNDAIPLKDGHLTRFHSRAPPGISVHDYLQRLTTHATLSPPILLSMVYYIDRLCAMYPAFTITSLTVHRFLIASGTVASKGLSDSFWTNKTYAKVGGVSIKELALLELEFLTRVEWRIVPKPEVLCDYYRSLVNRSDTHTFEGRQGI